MEKEKTLYLKAYDDYADAIFRYCYFKLSDREAAKDAVQEIFMKTWRYITAGKTIDAYKSFLYVTAANHIKDQWKKKKAIPMTALDTLEADFDAPDPKADFLNSIELKLALDKFKQLSDDDREVLTLRFIEELSPSEIAPILGVRDNAVSVRIHRALSRLQDILKKNENEN